jgi:lysine-N-methylase
MLQNLRPQYAKSFRCIGSACEDTCCQGWDVVIDRVAFERLGARLDVEQKQHLVILSNPTEQQHARIQLTSACTCPFLADDHLCKIQTQFGERYLPEICAHFPRVTQRIDGLSETSLLLSCPEAARLVLLTPQLMPSTTNSLPRYHNLLRLSDSPVRTNGSPHQFLWLIREFTLLVIQDRDYALWQRLFLLGMFTRRLSELTSSGHLDLVPRVLREHVAMIVEKKLCAAMDGIQLRTVEQLRVVLATLDQHLAITDASHARFRECIADFRDGLSLEAQTHLEIGAVRFEQAFGLFYKPFMAANPQLMENYLLNHVFRTLFPYGIDAQGKPRDPLTAYFHMCMLFTLVKALLVGMSARYQETFSFEHVVKLVQSFSKAIEQSPRFTVDRYLHLASADGISLLLKND